MPFIQRPLSFFSTSFKFYSSLFYKSQTHDHKVMLFWTRTTGCGGGLIPSGASVPTQFPEEFDGYWLVVVIQVYGSLGDSTCWPHITPKTAGWLIPSVSRLMDRRQKVHRQALAFNGMSHSDIYKVEKEYCVLVYKAMAVSCTFWLKLHFQVKSLQVHPWHLIHALCHSSQTGIWNKHTSISTWYKTLK